jgi:hypothetical protein
MRPDAPVQSHLHDSPALARRPQHGTAFVHGVARGLLDEDMRTRFHGGNGLERVPMIRRGDEHDLRLLLLQQLAEVVIRLRLVAIQVGDLFSRNFAHVLMHVAQADDLDASAGDCFLENVFTPPAAADERGAEFLRRVGGADERSGGEHGAGEGGLLDEPATVEQKRVFHGDVIDGGRLGKISARVTAGISRRSADRRVRVFVRA